MKKSLIVWVMAAAMLLSTGLFSQVQAGGVHANEKYEYVLDNGAYTGSVRLGVGYMSATANEIVTQGSFNENFTSQLTWETDELIMTGFGFSVQREWVAIHGDAWFSVTEGDNHMDDYDWIMEGPGWSDWSHHDDTVVESARLYDINAELFIPYFSNKHFLLSLFLGYKHETFEWDARGGSYVYSTTTFRDTTGTFENGIMGISYEQSFKTPYIGVGLRGSINQFEFAGRFIASTLVSAAARDQHHLRNFRTSASADNGNMYAFDISGSYKFTKNWALQLGYSFTSYDKMTGDATWYEVVDNEIVSTTWVNAESMDLETSMVFFSVTYTF